VKLGLRAKLFLVSFGLIAVSVGVADVYLRRALDRAMTERFRADLMVRVHLIEQSAATFGAPLGDLAAWDRLADELGRRGEGRVTFIGSDGVVLGDSEVGLVELAGVENHLARPEVSAALGRGEGTSMRFSDTVGHRMLYVAVPFSHEGRPAGVARLAKPLTQVDEAIATTRRLVLLGSGLALLVAVVMSSLAAHLLSRNVRALTKTARKMAGGDLQARTRAEGEDELAELGRTLDQLAESLESALGDLRAERDRLGRVLNGMGEGVLLLDRAGRVLLANPALREMLLLGGDIVGKTALEIARNAELKRILDTAEKSGEPVSGEVELVALKPRRLLVHAARLPDESGGVLAVFVDVTDLRRLESLRRDFVANVSHELRTPVASVRSAAETLRRAAEKRPEAAGEFIEIIERNAERLHRLIEDLLDLSRVEAREFRLSLEPIDVRSVAAHVISLLAPAAERRRIDVDLEIPEGIKPLWADRRALEQVLSNLVDNAVKYGAERGRVTLRAESQDGGVRVTVEDDGPGVEPQHLPRLFERFYRVDAGRSRELGGTGLGLSIVKHLVEAMEGSVGVESAPGKGSRFSFTIPAA
jgi:two-component system, OmpR family, phosphate regulon sensor histidine kinase PhoR